MGKLIFDTPDGVMKVEYSVDGITSIDLPRSHDKLNCPERDKGDESAGLENARKAASLLEEYYKGNKVDFRGVMVDLEGRTEFFMDVCRAVRSIERGEVRSYKEVASMVGLPGAARAVGRVMSSNPVPIIIPCHRVVASDGSLTGFSAEGGVKAKEALLRMEGVDFDDRGRVKFH